VGQQTGWVVVSIVYILTNESMPGYIKIGITERELNRRITELDTTSVPLPFQCYYAARVSDPRAVEKALHTAFGETRIRTNREFFTVDPFRVKAILSLLAIEEVTPREDIVVAPEDQEALEKAIKRSGRFSFDAVGIPAGTALQFVQDESILCHVYDDRSVSFMGEIMSTSRAAVLASQSLGYKAKAISGPWYWLHDGKTLDDIRRISASESEEEI
jgi:hypothetical protein